MDLQTLLIEIGSLVAQNTLSSLLDAKEILMERSIKFTGPDRERMGEEIGRIMGMIDDQLGSDFTILESETRSEG